MSGGSLFHFFRNFLLIAMLFHLPCIYAKQKHIGIWTTELAMANKGILEGYQLIEKLKSMEATSSTIELVQSELAKYRCLKKIFEAQDAEFERKVSSGYLYGKNQDKEQVVENVEENIREIGLSYANKLKSIKFVDAKNCPPLEEEFGMPSTTRRFESKYIDAQENGSIRT